MEKYNKEYLKKELSIILEHREGLENKVSAGHTSIDFSGLIANLKEKERELKLELAVAELQEKN